MSQIKHSVMIIVSKIVEGAERHTNKQGVFFFEYQTRLAF
jgi:hypothetical protein